MADTTLSTRLEGVVGGRTAKALERGFGLRTVRDLLWHLPRRYSERGELTPLQGLPVGEHVTVLAQVLDVRSRIMFEQLGSVFAQLVEQGIVPEVLYLEADDAAIVKRQESTRRPLPLQGDGRLLDGINRERNMLSTLRASADLVIDTTNINVHQLANRVAHAYGGDDGDRIRVAVMSFGFKNGLPLDADLVLDVRFLPNPHWVPELRPQTGLSEAVSSYVLVQNGAQEFLDRLEGLFETMAPGYVNEGKRQVTVAIGCTGGKHRSTAMSEAFAQRLRVQGVPVSVMHRDLGKE